MLTKIKLIRAVEYLQISQEGGVDFEKSKAKRTPADNDVILDFRK